MEPARLRFSAEQVGALLRPRSIAVVGASAQDGAFGNRLLRSMCGWRYQGRIYAVNPRYKKVLGVDCYPAIGDLPEAVDCAVFAISDQSVEGALVQAIRAGARSGVIFGRGYEPHEDGKLPLGERLAAMACEAAIPICGNNCMGFVNFVDGLQVSADVPELADRIGSVGLVSHSGASWSALVANQRQLYLNYAVSPGQELVTTTADFMRFLIEQPETRVIACILETARDPELLLDMFEMADRRQIPVAVLKLARSVDSRHFAVAHSGAMAGNDAAYRAVFEKHHVAYCESIDELIDTVELLGCARAPQSDALGAVTDSGGERELLVDIAADIGCRLAQLAPASVERLTAVLDPGVLAENPVDSYGDGRTLLAECLEIVAEDSDVGVVALSTNLTHGRPYYLEASTQAAEHVFEATEKPVVVLSHVHSAVSREAARRLRDKGIPVLMGTRNGLIAVRNFVAYHLRGATSAIDTEAPSADLLEHWRTMLAGATGPLPSCSALKFVEQLVAPIPRTLIAADADSVTQAAEQIGYPIVLKTAVSGILHKSEVGGVVTSIGNADQAREAYREMSSRLGPEVLVQEQAPQGVEILLGMIRDAQFGPMAIVGMGGVFVEVQSDSCFFVPPVSTSRASRLLTRLRGYPILLGARGRPPANLALLSETIARFSVICSVLGNEIAELDINPLIVNSSGVMAVDALVAPIRQPQAANPAL